MVICLRKQEPNKEESVQKKEGMVTEQITKRNEFLIMQKTPHRQETKGERQRKLDLLKYHPNPTRLHTSSLNIQMSPSAFFGNNNFKTSISLKYASFYLRQNLTLCAKKPLQRWNTTGFFPLSKWLKFCQNQYYCLLKPAVTLDRIQSQKSDVAVQNRTRENTFNSH